MSPPGHAEVAVWGSHAERFVAQHTSAVLAAVFARSLHLQDEGDFLCIGDPTIGRGPLNATVDAAGWARLTRCLPSAGRAVRINAGRITIGDAILDTVAASTWRPPPWASVVDAEAVAAALDDLAHRAQAQAPADGLARIVLASAGEPNSSLDRIARPRVQRLRQWARARLSAPKRGAAPADLLGLGPGLTPSGDDLLCGALVALHAIDRIDVCRDLDTAIAGAAPNATTLLSRAFLRAAADGHGYEALHVAIMALIENRLSGKHLDGLTRIGHTSGWDALAGAAIVLHAFGTTADTRDSSPPVRPQSAKPVHTGGRG